jgi:hypothetical protein
VTYDNKQRLQQDVIGRILGGHCMVVLDHDKFKKLGNGFTFFAFILVSSYIKDTSICDAQYSSGELAAFSWYNEDTRIGLG